MASRSPAPPDNDSLAHRLRELRVARGLSQTELAGETVSASMISLLESGRREPTERVLALLAERLRTSVDYLRHGMSQTTADQVRLLLVEAELALHARQPDAALGRFTELVHRLDTGSTPRWSEHIVLRTRLGLAAALEEAGRYEEAVTELESLRSRATDAGEGALLDIDVTLSRCYRRSGRHSECLELTRTTIQVAESLGLYGMSTHSHLVINLIHELHEHRRVADAVVVAARHLDGVLIPASAAQAEAYRAASRHAAAAGRTVEAIAIAERALAGYRAITDARSTAMMRVVAATVALRHDAGAVDRATAALFQAYEVLSPLGAPTELAFCETALARAALRRRKTDEAMRWASWAIQHLHGLAPSADRAWALMVRCRCHAATGRVDLAEAEALAAREVLIELSPGRRTAGGWRELGDVLRLLGDDGAALSAYEHALDCLDVRQVGPDDQ